MRLKCSRRKSNCSEDAHVKVQRMILQTFTGSDMIGKQQGSGWARGTLRLDRAFSMFPKQSDTMNLRDAATL